jgi:hypothetical protein
LKTSGSFRFSSFARQFGVEEPRVYAVAEEANFPTGFNVVGARLIEVRYQAGGLGQLFELIEAAVPVEGGSFQALLEGLEDAFPDSPLVICVRGADQLLADVGPALLHVIAGWEAFTHHANGVSAMYLVLETGPSATVNTAFYPGGVVSWR